MDLSRPRPDAANQSPGTPNADTIVAAGRTARPGPWIATLAFAAVALGRGLSEALPGARSGIETWIHASNLVGAAITQLAAILAATEAALLLVATLWERKLGHVYRLVAMPSGAALITLIALSIRQRLGSPLLVTVAISAAVLAAAAAAQLLRHASTRAAGLVIGASTAAGLCYLAARHGTLAETGMGYTQVPADWLRPVATMALTLDAVATVLALVWLGRGARSRRFFAAIAAAMGLAFVCGWTAARGAEPDAGLGPIVASRFVAALTPHPAPLIAESIRGSFEVFALLAALVLIWIPGRPQPLRVGLGLVLLARASLDIPLCALLLVLGSLAGPLLLSRPGGQSVENVASQKREDLP